MFELVFGPSLHFSTKSPPRSILPSFCSSSSSRTPWRWRKDVPRCFRRWNRETERPSNLRDPLGMIRDSCGFFSLILKGLRGQDIKLLGFVYLVNFVYRLGSHGMKITILRHDLGNICLKPFPAALWPRKNRTRGKDAEGGGAKLPSQVVFLPTFFSRVDCYTPWN